MENQNNSAPEISFYFKLEFAIGTDRPALAFRDIHGFPEFDMEEMARGRKNGFGLRIPKIVKQSNLVCKQALTPLKQGVLSDWIKSTSDPGGRPCSILVSLVDAQGNKLAAWNVTDAYPVKWETSPFDAGEKGLIIETIEFVYYRMERKK